MVIYLCEDEFNSILCGVYDAWMSRLGHDNVKLKLRDKGNLEMFAEYRDVEVTEEKLCKVEKAIQQKISQEVYKWVYKAALSCEDEKADRIYRFLIYGFHCGAEITESLNIPAVYEVFKMNRSISGEAHLLTEFVRFSQMQGGILLSKIGPKNNILSLIAPHFADRFCEERWIIYDENRKKAAIYAPDGGWLIVSVDSSAWQEKLAEETDEAMYAGLWKAFFNSVAIQERTNYVCQRSHLPLRYRAYMTEFGNN